jgi:anti-sigma regulatory factor (Ser/Thr protein kinase)
VTSKVAPPLEVKAILELVLASATRLFQGEGGSIMLRIGDDELEVITSPTNPAALGARVKFGEGVSGKVAATLEPMLVSGRISQRTIVVDSSLCLPLLEDGELFGILNINGRPLHTFTEHDLAAGSEFCAHAADALTAARHYEVSRLAGEPEPERHLNEMQRHFVSAASIDFVPPLARDRLDVAAIARSVTASEDRAGRPTALRTANARILGEGQAVRRLLQELVDNAHRHGKRPVRIALEATPEAVEIVVADRGPGVPEDERGRLFEPYARLDRPSDAEGLGLGLTIVRRLAKAMRGTVSFSDSPEGGATVTVRFPPA